MLHGANMTDEALRAKNEATRLLPIIRRQGRRAFVIELTGTPKAGKTTSVSVLKRFFEKCGYRVHLLKERAGECPLPMKGHFFFNAWTTCTMIAEVLQTVDTDVDVMILDRGFFDALIWLELQYRRAQVTSEERRTFVDFVLLQRWRSLVDVTVVMKVDPKLAVERENRNLIIPREGSVMNPSALAEFNTALEATSTDFGGQFPLIPFSSSPGIRESNTKLVEELLVRLEGWADPPIVAIPRALVLECFNGRTFVPMPEAETVLAKFREHAITAQRRSVIEENKDLVQLVACGVLRTTDGKYFVLRRDEKDKKSKSYGRHTLWKGCHLEATAGTSVEAMATRLRRRILEDLHLAAFPSPSATGLAWVASDTHLGAMFEFRISSADAIESLKRKEFRKLGRFEPLEGRLLEREEVLTRAAELEIEPWSRAVLEHEGKS